MDDKLESKDNELYQRVDEVLHYLWDPIGVCDAPWARNEYLSYLPTVFSYVKSNRSKNEIAEHLTGIERNSMGLADNKERALKVAEVLLEYREKIIEEDSA